MRDKSPHLTDYEKTFREFKWEIPECPGELEFLRELPKTTTGKIRRSELKSREIEKRRRRK